MSSIKTLFLPLFIGALCLSGSASSRPLSYDRYDARIEDAVEKNWVRCPAEWHWWKAQLYQESLLDPDAVSPVGAEGLAQFMPATWSDITRRLGWSGISPRAAGPAITAGAYYMERLCRGWSSPRPELDRLRLAQASYNAGFGSLLKAQEACGSPALYRDIAACLPCITGHHSHETLTYVERITRWKEKLDDRTH